MGTAEAVEALLGRFTIRIDPGIIDQEEKDAAYQGIVDAGEAAVDPVRKFLATSEHISWPVKILEKLLSSEEVVTELLAVLETMDTEYERDPEKKIQVVAYLEDRKDPRIVEAVRRFLEDMNETVRFHSVSALLAQDEAESVREALLDMLPTEESVRIRARVLDGFKSHAWKIPDDRRDAYPPPPPRGLGPRQRRRARSVAGAAPSLPLLGDLNRGREVEREADVHHVVQAVDVVVAVDDAVGERLAVLILLVRARGVPREGKGAPLEGEPEPVGDVHHQADAGGERDVEDALALDLTALRGADVGRRAREARRAHADGDVLGTLRSALIDEDACDACEDVEVGVDEELLEERQLAAERDERELQREGRSEAGDLVAELRGVREAEHVARRSSARSPSPAS